MDITFAIVRAENADYLCHHANGIYVDVSNPMRTFVAGEDKFRLIEPDRSLERKEYRFRGQNCYLVPRFYANGWLALLLQSVEDESEYIVLSVNLEEMNALGLPDRTFIDVNHYPDAMAFLSANGLATDSVYAVLQMPSSFRTSSLAVAKSPLQRFNSALAFSSSLIFSLRSNRVQWYCLSRSLYLFCHFIIS